MLGGMTGRRSKKWIKGGKGEQSEIQEGNEEKEGREEAPLRESREAV